MAGLAAARTCHEAGARVLVLEARDDVRRFLEAIARRELRRRYTEDLDNARTNLTLAAEVGRLAAERCRISPELARELK